MTTSKLTMTEEEKLELAKKLDEDLDEFIHSRQKSTYTDGWKEETWREEIEKHPFFMSKLPEENEELPPLLEAFQQLKYDPEQNTNEELALAHKEDGNFNFKMKKYRFAIINYTEGLKLKCGNIDIDASLHLNRAAAHFHLQNYRSSLNDSLLAAKLKPDYIKAIVRAAQCCVKLERHADGIQWCDYGLRLKNSDASLVEIRTQLIQSQKMKERNARKAEIKIKKEELNVRKLVEALQSRGIRAGIKGKIIDNESLTFDLSTIEPCHPAALGKRVHLVDDFLIWPVLFLYPEFGETDFIQEFHEESTFLEHLETMFSEQPPWDSKGNYTALNIRIYYENLESGKLHAVDPQSSLRDVLSQQTCVVRAGTPGFICLAEGTAFQIDFLSKYK